MHRNCLKTERHKRTSFSDEGLTPQWRVTANISEINRQVALAIDIYDNMQFGPRWLGPKNLFLTNNHIRIIYRSIFRCRSEKSDSCCSSLSNWRFIWRRNDADVSKCSPDQLEIVKNTNKRTHFWMRNVAQLDEIRLTEGNKAELTSQTSNAVLAGK